MLSSDSLPGPVLSLPPNFIPRFYRGSNRLAAFRGVPAGPFDSEDWVGSVTTVFGGADGLGLSRLADGRLLVDVIAAHPGQLLGPEHLAAFGTDLSLLVKLLDAGQRLAVHTHPSRDFARQHLHSVHGKTEAWVVLEATEDAVVHLGFSREVARKQLSAWVERQDTEAMLAAMNQIPVAPGATVLVPAGTPHAIGSGILLVELQEPTDFSIMLESKGFPIDSPGGWHLGIGPEVALDSVDASGWDAARLAGVLEPPRPLGPGRSRLLPPAADPFFRAERIGPGARLDQGVSVLVGIAGGLRLVDPTGAAAELPAGASVLVPWSAGEISVEGQGTAIRCRPPAAS